MPLKGDPAWLQSGSESESVTTDPTLLLVLLLFVVGVRVGADGGGGRAGGGRACGVRAGVRRIYTRTRTTHPHTQVMERDKFNKRNLSLESELESQLQADPSFDYDNFESVGSSDPKQTQKQNTKHKAEKPKETIPKPKDGDKRDIGAQCAISHSVQIKNETARRLPEPRRPHREKLMTFSHLTAGEERS